MLHSSLTKRRTMFSLGAAASALLLTATGHSGKGKLADVTSIQRVHTMGGHIAEVPIEFRDRTLGRSKMSMRIVVEALWLVTRWGARDRLHRTRPLVGAHAK